MATAQIRAAAPLALRPLALAVAATLLVACGEKQTAPAQPAAPAAAPAAATAQPSGVEFMTNETVALTRPDFDAKVTALLAEGKPGQVLQITGMAYANEKPASTPDLGLARAETASILFMDKLPNERIKLVSAPQLTNAPAERFDAIQFKWIDAPATAVAAAPAAAPAPAAALPAPAPVPAPVAAAPAPAPVAAAPAPVATPAPAPASVAAAPAAKPAAPAAGSKMTPPAGTPVVTSPVVLSFATGSATPAMAAAQRDALRALAQASQQAGYSLTVTGHTDNTGDAETNKRLAQARAEAVKQRLVSLGAKADAIKVESFGADQPVADNATAEGRAKNRRVEVKS
ncbi:OmpA family protein [Piscinibacterium candidicorallinum]|uniref:OmpA family protein n=1 Tax=Piscinibacterium candidicorallinum TaxID=1793872 RepID=A0ABV7H6D3_9BURK